MIAADITPRRGELDTDLSGAGADLHNQLIRTDVPEGQHYRSNLPALRQLETGAAIEVLRLAIE